jgi:hypothetical protein
MDELERLAVRSLSESERNHDAFAEALAKDSPSVETNKEARLCFVQDAALFEKCSFDYKHDPVRTKLSRLSTRTFLGLQSWICWQGMDCIAALWMELITRAMHGSNR